MGGESANVMIFNYVLTLLATSWLSLPQSFPGFVYGDLNFNPNFNRPCQTAQQCVFTPRGSSDNVYLDCKEGSCACARFTRIADVPSWDLAWSDSPIDESNIDTPQCLIAETGPCGVDGGLKISCMPGFDCIERRCRSREKIGTFQLGDSCKETVDCQKGLICITTAFYFQPMKTCVDPKNPHSVTNHHRNNIRPETEEEPTTATTSTTTTTTTTSTSVPPAVPTLTEETTTTESTTTTTTTVANVQPEIVQLSQHGVVVMSNNSTMSTNSNDDDHVEDDKGNSKSNNMNSRTLPVRDEEAEDEDRQTETNNNAAFITSSPPFTFIFSILITVATANTCSVLLVVD